MKKRQRRPTSTTPRVSAKPKPAQSSAGNEHTLLQMQRQYGNRYVQRALEEDQKEQKGWGFKDPKADENTLEINKDTYKKKADAAYIATKRIKTVIEGNWDRILEDSWGFQGMNAAKEIHYALNEAFIVGEAYSHTYVGSDYYQILLHQIHQEKGLYKKLSILVGMEPHHARAIRNYLGIEPPTKFEYEVSMQGVGGGQGVEAVGMGVDITCYENGTKLWHTLYAFAGGGAGASVIPVTASIGSADFDLDEFWSPKDFEGTFTFSTAAAGFGIGVGLGEGTFHGKGDKGPIHVDLTGLSWMSPNVAIGSYIGKLTIGTGVKYRDPSKGSAPVAPNIQVLKRAKETAMAIFEENSTQFPGFDRGDYWDVILPMLRRGGYKLLIRGSSSYGTEHNRKLLSSRLKAVQDTINGTGIMSGALGSEGLADDMVTKKQRVNSESPDKEGDDPLLDRVIEVQLWGNASEEANYNYRRGRGKMR